MPRKKLIKDPRKKFTLCVKSALEIKAKDLVVLRVSELSSFADYFLICHGDSCRQVQGITNAIEERMKKAGFIPLGIEGYREGNWILMDYGDIIVHIFQKQVREFYDLERLWIDAPRLEINEKTTSKKLNEWWNS